MSGHGQMGQEEHLRFFRDHMLLHSRECSTSSLNQFFKTLCRPQDRSPKTVLAADFIDALRFMASTDDFGEASPPRAHRGLIGGMQGFLPEISNRPRPGGFLIQGPSAEPPFCFNGRDLPPNNRLAVNDRNFSTVGERKSRMRPLTLSSSAPVLPVGTSERPSPTGGGFSEIARRYALLGPSSTSDDEPEFRTPPPQRSDSKALRRGSKELRRGSKEHSASTPWADRTLMEALQVAPENPAAPGVKSEVEVGAGHSTPQASSSLGFGTSSPHSSSPGKRAKRKDAEECRSAYFVLNGAEALNRVEHRLFHAGLDVRGHFHRRHADAAQAEVS